MKPETKAAIDAYITEHRAGGDFITAVLENDLRKAIQHADLRNRQDLHETTMYVFCNVPSRAWGSPEAVKNWLANK